MPSQWWAPPVTTSGTLTANGQSVVAEIDGAPSIMVQVSGTWQLDLVVQVSMDNATWSNPLYLWEFDRFPAFHGHIQLGMNALSGATSRNGQFRVATEGMKYVRVASQAAGGTPGSASVSIMPSPVAVAFPTQGYNVLVFDSVLPTASRTSPVFPAPPPGWRWDNAETSDGGTQTSWANAKMTVQLSDNYSMSPLAVQQAVTVGPIGVSSYLSGENATNARQTYLSNWLQFVLGAGTFSTGTARITIWVNFIPALTSPFSFNPFFADQSSGQAGGIEPDVGALNAGQMPWVGAMLLATDAAAGTNGGNLRRLRVDGDQKLIMTPAVSPTNLGLSISRNQRNLGAKVLAAGFSLNIYGIQVLNNQAAAAFVQLFDAATTAGVTLGTTLPNWEILVPANTFYTFPVPAVGLNPLNGLVCASTTTEAGSTASASGVQLFLQTNN